MNTLNNNFSSLAKKLFILSLIIIYVFIIRNYLNADNELAKKSTSSQSEIKKTLKTEDYFSSKPLAGKTKTKKSDQKAKLQTAQIFKSQVNTINNTENKPQTSKRNNSNSNKISNEFDSKDSFNENEDELDAYEYFESVETDLDLPPVTEDNINQMPEGEFKDEIMLGYPDSFKEKALKDSIAED